MIKKTIKSRPEQDIISEFLLQNWEFKLKRDLTYLKLLQKKLQKTQIINNIFMSIKINSIKTFIFTLQNFILVLALSIFSLYSISIVAVSSQNKEQANLLATDSNSVVSLEDCDISVSFPKKIEGYDTYIRSTKRKEFYKYLDSIQAEKKEYDRPAAQSLFAGIATSPTSFLPPNYQQDLNVSCGEINNTFDYKKSNYWAGDPLIADSKINGSDLDRNYQIENLTNTQFKDQTNWLIADSSLDAIKIYKSRFINTDQSWVIQFEKNKKRYFISFYTAQYSGDKKSNLEIKNILSQYNFQFDSVAKSVPNKNLEYDEIGEFQEFGLGGNDFDKFIEKITNFVYGYGYILQILLIIGIIVAIYFSLIIFVKVTKINLNKLQRFTFVDFQLSFISLICIALFGQLYFLGYFGYNIYGILLFWQIITSLVYSYIYFKVKSFKYLSMHLIFLSAVLCVYASIIGTHFYIDSLMTKIVPYELNFILNILNNAIFVLVPIRYIILFFDLIQVFKKVEAKK